MGLLTPAFSCPRHHRADSTHWRWVPSTSASLDPLAWVPFALASFDTLALGSPRLGVVQHLVVGFLQPPCLSTRWVWVSSASASFDPLALGSLSLHVFRHGGFGFPSPCRHSTRASGSVRLSVVRHVVVGYLSFRVFRHVDFGFLPSRRRLTFWRWVPLAPVSKDTLTLGSLRLRQLVAGSCCAVLWFASPSGVCYMGIGPAISFVVGLVVVGEVSVVSPMDGVLMWRGYVEEGGGVLNGQLRHWKDKNDENETRTVWASHFMGPPCVLLPLPFALNLRTTGPHPSGEGRGTACT